MHVVVNARPSYYNPENFVSGGYQPPTARMLRLPVRPPTMVCVMSMQQGTSCTSYTTYTRKGQHLEHLGTQSGAEGHGPRGATGTPRPRLLALHGWRTSAAVLAQQLQRSGLETVLEQVAEVVYLDGPHPAGGPPTRDVRRAFQPPFFEWWDAVQDAASGKVVRYEGVQTTLSLLRAELQRAAASGRPVEGLLGFSQGAMLAGLVMALQERREAGFQDVPPLRCAVLIGGGLIRDPAFAYLYAGSGDAGGSGGGNSNSCSNGAGAQDTAHIPASSGCVAAAATTRPLPPPSGTVTARALLVFFSQLPCHRFCRPAEG
ncbi:hypothetical protein Vretimale_16229 [Volvox reticuliferus]|uniref:Serine hydrolase domain-containing protein n=1 Tax=Volvox reticuliferus TaxID=1737510 RepID=A0A8J4LX21_9CHLO|nr:hypothetical protein Vretimale_16229 [Volvox reticuliferus]